MNDETLLLPLSDVSAALGGPQPGNLRRACRAGLISGAQKVGSQWLCSLAAARAWRDSQGERHRDALRAMNARRRGARTGRRGGWPVRDADGQAQS